MKKLFLAVVVLLGLTTVGWSQTLTYTPTFTLTPAKTYTPTFTYTPTSTWSNTPAAGTNTWTMTPTYSQTPTYTFTSTPTPTKTYTPTKTPVDSGLFRDAHYDASIPGPNKTALPVSSTLSNPATPDITKVAQAALQLTQVANLIANNNAWQNTYGGQVLQSPTPTATYTGAQLTATATPTAWIPLTTDQILGSPTPTPATVATPVSGLATGFILDGAIQSGTVQDNALLFRNGTLVAKIPLAPAGGMAHPRYFADTNGNATWGLGTTASASSTITYNYRLWIAPVGTPPPGMLR